MKPRHVIYMSGTEVVLYTWDRHGYAAVSGYELPDGNPGPVVSYLRQTPTAAIAIIVDVLEEEHNRDTMARLGIRDQQAMLARKLARVFPRTSYRTAAVQGRMPDDPQMNRILLSGLTKADHLRTLQALLAEAKLPVATVCSPSLLSRPLLDKLRPANPADATLLVSRQHEGSLRLSFFRGRDLVGSRLMRRSLAAPPGDFERLVKQLEESVRYFDAAFAPSATNPIDVLLLCEPGIDSAKASAEGVGHEGFRLHVPDPAVAAKRLGLQGSIPEANADLLFVELLRRHAPAGNFAPAAERRTFQLYQVGVFGKAACLALAFGALAGAAFNVVDILAVNRDAAAVRRAIGDINSQLGASMAGEMSNGADPLEMQRIGTAWQLIQQHSMEPEEVLVLISRALEANPQVRIEGIEWAPVQSMMGAATGDTALPVEGDAAAADSTQTGEADPPAEDSDAGTPEQRVRLAIRGSVEPFDGNYPLAFLGVRTFMQSLRSDPRVISVKARKEPLDVNVQSTLTGEVTPQMATGKASFTINVLLRVGDEPA